MRPLLREPERRALADAAPPADHHHDVPGQQLGGALPGDLLVHLPPLQRPVLELEHVALGDELEPVHRFGVVDRLERRAIAEVRGHGAPLVGERRDDPEPRHQNDLGPVVERALARAAWRRWYASYSARAAPAGSAPARPARRPGPPDRDRARPAAGRHGADAPASPSRASQLRRPLRRQLRKDVVGVVEVEDHPVRPAQRAAHDRQHHLSQTLALVRGRHGRSAPRPAAAGRGGRSRDTRRCVPRPG